jgi:DNA helicase HerA-like ATPase
MSTKIIIGERLDGGAVTLDVQSLIYSRALIQANSGGGKSGLMRVIAEQVAAKIPTIIIDKEGEYHTLREKLDIVLVGERGEIAANVRSAGLLARKLVELGASAVCDLYELKLP